MRDYARVPEGRASARPALSANDTEARTCGSMSLRKESAPERRHPIHLSPLEAHNRSVIVFVTCCTLHRRKILASPAVHAALIAAWGSATTWLVGRYVIMRDHVHLFCTPNGIEAPALERWMRYWKSLATKALGLPGGSVWQRHHWDRQLRRGESYSEKWEYVCGNPVRHGLVRAAADWPYQGELNGLRW